MRNPLDIDYKDIALVYSKVILQTVIFRKGLITLITRILFLTWVRFPIRAITLSRRLCSWVVLTFVVNLHFLYIYNVQFHPKHRCLHLLRKPLDIDQFCSYLFSFPNLLIISFIFKNTFRSKICSILMFPTSVLQICFCRKML